MDKDFVTSLNADGCLMSDSRTPRLKENIFGLMKGSDEKISGGSDKLATDSAKEAMAFGLILN